MSIGYSLCALMLGLTLAACARATHQANVPVPDSQLDIPAADTEPLASSCQALCAVPGGIDECPIGTPCPRLNQEEADAVFEAATDVTYEGKACDPKR